jgi:hypothetical protein
VVGVTDSFTGADFFCQTVLNGLIFLVGLFWHDWFFWPGFIFWLDSNCQILFCEW